MKIPFSKFLALITVLCLFTSAQASHIFGGYLQYQAIDTNQLVLTMHVYSDDASTVPAFGTLKTVQAISSCSGTSYNFSIPFVATDTADNTCASLIQQLNYVFHERIYTDTITLPFSCSEWNFTVTPDLLSPTTNYSMSDFVLRASYNSNGSPLHNSVSFDGLSVQRVALGRYSTLPHTIPVSQASGISRELVDVVGTGTSSYWLPDSINTPSNPLDPIQFRSDTNGAKYSFNARYVETNNLGDTICITDHVFMVNTVIDLKTPPQLDTTTAPNTMLLCPGDSFSGSWQFSVADTTNVLRLRTESLDLFGSWISYSVSGTNPITISLTATAGSSGSFYIPIIVEDTNCSFINYASSGIEIHVQTGVQFPSDTLTGCQNEPVQVQVISGDTIVWSRPSGVPFSTSEISCLNCKNPVFTLAASETIIASSATSSNCAQNDTMYLALGDNQASASISWDSLICQGDTADISINGTSAGSSFLWSGILNPGTGSSSAQAIISNGSSDTVNLEISDASGFCSKSFAMTIVQAPAIQGQHTITEIPCYPDSNAYNFTPSSGSSPVQSMWIGSTPILIPWSAENLQPGLHAVTIIDSFGCSITDSITVSDLSGPSLSLTNHTPVLCHGDSTGTVLLTGTGLNGIATYGWMNESSANGLFMQVPAGSHVFTVTDSLGCTDSISHQTSQPTAVLASLAPDTIICAGQPVTIQAVGSGGTGLLSFAFNSTTGFGAGSLSFSITSDTLVSVVAMDQNGCLSDSASQWFFTPDDLLVDPINDTTVYAGHQFTVCLNTNGGIAPYTYAFGTQNSACLDTALTTSDTVTLVVTDFCGVSNSTSFFVTAQDPSSVIETTNQNFSTYPNPVQDIIRFSETVTGTATIYSSKGSVIQQNELFESNGIQLNPDLPRGTYILVIQTSDGIRNSKFIK